ncbi:DNA-directed RNA polymerase II core subunit rpo21 [Marasmius tenuissimus]|nr:DNA-directed RNA polymerase II core subunit rpo21 [Marasmius tenuissimus]
MDSAFIEKQSTNMFGLNNKEFKHIYRVDVTDPSGGFLPDVLQVGLDDSSLELQTKLDKKFTTLIEDCRLLRNFMFPRQDPNVSQYLLINIQCIVQNAM